MSNGKGDRNRTTNVKKFRDNYSQINWRNSNESKSCDAPLNKHIDLEKKLETPTKD